MKNLFKLFGLIVLVAVIGFSFAALSLTGCDDGSGGGGGGGSLTTHINGTWKAGDGEEITFNNGSFVISENNTQNMKGTYTASNTARGISANITMAVKEIHGDLLNKAFEEEDEDEKIDITFESKWYNRKQVTDAFRKFMKDNSVSDEVISNTLDELSAGFDAMFPTITGTIDDNTMTLGDTTYTKDVASTGPGTKPGTGGDMTWKSAANSPFDEFVQAVAYGNGKFVAGSGYSGKHGKIATSTDGASWTEIPPTNALDIINPNTGNVASDKAGIYAITFGNGKFVAAANSSGFIAAVDSMNYSRIIYSQNGTTWTIADDVSSIFGKSWIQAITWGGNKFVAVGSGGKMAYSPDGVTWTAVEDSTFGTARNNIYGIAWGNNKFVAVGEYDGKMAYSPDGATWTAVEDSKFGTSSISAVAYGSNKFVAVGGGAKIAYSSDGVTWTAVDGKGIFGDWTIKAIAYGNGRFVAGDLLGTAATSTDGVTWTLLGRSILGSAGNSDNTICAIAYGNNRFVAVGDVGRIAYLSGN
jgi:hypothetical protein